MIYPSLKRNLVTEYAEYLVWPSGNPAHKSSHRSCILQPHRSHFVLVDPSHTWEEFGVLGALLCLCAAKAANRKSACARAGEEQ